MPVFLECIASDRKGLSAGSVHALASGGASCGHHDRREAAHPSLPPRHAAVARIRQLGLNRGWAQSGRAGLPALTTDLVKRFNVIALGDLNVGGMTRIAPLHGRLPTLAGRRSATH